MTMILLAAVAALPILAIVVFAFTLWKELDLRRYVPGGIALLGGILIAVSVMGVSEYVDWKKIQERPIITITGTVEDVYQRYIRFRPVEWVIIMDDTAYELPITDYPDFDVHHWSKTAKGQTVHLEVWEKVEEASFLTGMRNGGELCGITDENGEVVLDSEAYRLYCKAANEASLREDILGAIAGAALLAVGAFWEFRKK